MGVSAGGQPPAHWKMELAKKPIRNTSDRFILRRHKLRKRTIQLGMLNVQGIRNKTGEIIKGLEELRQDITILTEMKKKGNGVETLGPYTFIVEFQKKKEQREEYLF